ncbi:coproporphyrinogen III oxidase, anaerobic [Seinonella peptonophila]|uniref:Coproporphyrinogen III oxidase, anaerobic n=1 Tax=Seinonella peptonophila TaxID=112248 RepID=A0A1M5BGM6_9BACL|nr:coproporphyrinogen III oxidase, anaerobic [Seinonella peptonophila]
MGNWQVTGLDPNYNRDVELILQLFMQSKVVTKSDDIEGRLEFQLSYEGSTIQVNVRVLGQTQPLQGTGIYTHVLTSQLSEKEQRKQIKQAISHALLQALEKLTSVQQPWGILTGVRPTKLYHRLLLEGRTDAETRHHLTEKYRLVPEKTSLLQEIVARQRAALPDLYDLRREVSLYIGIPFCPTKCAYCTFPAYAIQGRNGSVEAFLEGLHQEVRVIGKWLTDHHCKVTTLYVGGGTPTSLESDQLDALFTTLTETIPDYDQIREVTVEAGRPDTLEAAKLDVLRKWKVDRISINPQSFRDETLRSIGRHHTVAETLDAYERAREMGFDNINMDLIIGLPDEDLTIFEESLQVIERLRPESLTVHTLSFKRGSTMTQKRGDYQVAERDEIAQMVKRAREWTAEQAYFPYYLYRQKNILGNQENVGYSIEGKESLYNIIIMEELQTIIGLGCGAVSKLVSPYHRKIDRYANPKEPQAYIDTYQTHIQGKLAVLDQLFDL